MSSYKDLLDDTNFLSELNNKLQEINTHIQEENYNKRVRDYFQELRQSQDEISEFLETPQFVGWFVYVCLISAFFVTKNIRVGASAGIVFCFVLLYQTILLYKDIINGSISDETVYDGLRK